MDGHQVGVMDNNRKREIIQLVESRRITPEEGFQRLKELRRKQESPFFSPVWQESIPGSTEKSASIAGNVLIFAENKASIAGISEKLRGDSG